jgi:hypothetical protein
MAGQPTSPIAKARPTSSGNHDDHTIGSRPSAIGSIDDDSQRVDVLDLLVLAMEPMVMREVETTHHVCELRVLVPIVYYNLNVSRAKYKQQLQTQRRSFGNVYNH